MKKLCFILIFILIFSLLLTGCELGKPKPTADPHAGQVYLYDGYDWVWYTPIEGLAINDFSKEQFRMVGDTPVYIGADFDVRKGIDVSEHQLDIDWNQVGTQGYEFCYIRVGRRGYTEGGLFEDTHFEQNYSGAKNCGMDIGVYFFSQAITVAEAIEEANWVISRVQGYDVSLPIVFDWEKVEAEDARTANLDVNTLTDCAVAFCETVKRAGYEPCIYYNRTTGYYRYDLSRLSAYKVWFALPVTPPDVTYPSFYYHFDMWQYSLTGKIPGISADTDLDYIFIPRPKPTPLPEQYS